MIETSGWGGSTFLSIVFFRILCIPENCFTGIRGSYQTIWSFPLTNVKWHSVTWQYTTTTPTDQTLYRTRPFTEFWVGATGVACRQGTLTHPDTWSRPFGTCICSTCWDQSFSELAVILPDYALRISLGTFSILLHLCRLKPIIQKKYAQVILNYLLRHSCVLCMVDDSKMYSVLVRLEVGTHRCSDMAELCNTCRGELPLYLRFIKLCFKSFAISECNTTCTYLLRHSCALCIVVDSHMCRIIVRVEVDTHRRSDMAHLDRKTCRRYSVVFSVDGGWDPPLKLIVI